MAAWAYADKKYGGDEAQMKEFIKKLYRNVVVLDSGARGATTSFVENGQGDVLVAWEMKLIYPCGIIRMSMRLLLQA